VVAQSAWLGDVPQTGYNFWVGHRPEDCGGGCWSDGTYLSGPLDELSLYNRALSQAEIQSIYNAGSAGKCASSDCTPAPAGIVGWWKGDSNAVDSVNGNNGVVAHAGYTTGVVSAAFAFDPESFPWGTYTGVQIADQPAYVLTNALTIEGWVRPRGDGYEIFFRGDHRPGLDPYSLGMQGNNMLGFYISSENGSYASVFAPLTYNQWCHVAATFDGAAGTISLYTNGVLAAQTATGVRPFGTLQAGQSPGIGIGNVNDGGNNFPFFGDIDEIALYNRALTKVEIQSLYIAGSAGKCPSPSIVQQPVNQTTVAGAGATLTVGMGGAGPFSYQWRFNGINLAGATNATLTLTNLHAGQSGAYSVVVTTPDGTLTSAAATVTVLAQTTLAYNYSGSGKTITLGVEASANFSGQMFFIPATTNGVFVGWATINGKKQYWVSPFGDYLLVSIPGSFGHVYTVLGNAGNGWDANGQPHIWAYLHQGLNASLTVGTRQKFSFPNTFTCNETHVYPDVQTGNLILSQASSTYTFSSLTTQTANNNGQTLTDLVNALTKSLVKQGYQKQ
jgi:hypothetical protein